uniref:Putative secreted protein n=1 Tax=Amblyomma triste TaxID=251400 RepID=A0A023G310_AMBTT
MQRNMIFSLIFIVGFALCQAEITPEDKAKIEEYKKIYKQALEVVQTNRTLKLVQVTSTLRTKVAACLTSDFISIVQGGVTRTLGSKREGSSPAMTVYVALDHSTSFPVTPKLQIHGVRGEVPPGWDETEFIKYAGKDCLIIQPVNFRQGNLPCLIWAFDGSNECTSEYKNQCKEKSVVADMHSCEWQ